MVTQEEKDAILVEFIMEMNLENSDYRIIGKDDLVKLIDNSSIPERVIVDNLSNELQEIKKMMNEVHSITTGKLYQPKDRPKRLTKKQKEDLELLQRSREAHNRMLNRQK